MTTIWALFHARKDDFRIGKKLPIQNVDRNYEKTYAAISTPSAKKHRA